MCVWQENRVWSGKQSHCMYCRKPRAGGLTWHGGRGRNIHWIFLLAWGTGWSRWFSEVLQEITAIVKWLEMTQPTFSPAAKWEVGKFVKLWYLATMIAKREIPDNSESVQFTESSERIVFRGDLRSGSNHAKLTINNWAQRPLEDEKVVTYWEPQAFSQTENGWNKRSLRSFPVLRYVTL